MPKRYTNTRREEIRKKNARQKRSKKNKIEITNEITCMKCGKPSGWTNDDLRYVGGQKEIKCQSCKKPCIQLFGKQTPPFTKLPKNDV